MAATQLKGIFPPMLTPFKENGDVDFKAFEHNMLKWNQDNLAGYLVLGSNSETIYLTEDERFALLKQAKEIATPGRILIAGTGSDSIRDTIRQTNYAAKLGYDTALVLTPFYYGSSMTAKALIKFFTEVAENVDIPIMIYNVPKFTGVNITADAVKELAFHPNIIGMKDSSGNIPQMATWKRIVPNDFNLLVGTASALFPALTLGVDGGILALANTHPNECAKVQELFWQGSWEESRALYQKLYPINEAITATYGIPGLKYVADKMGYSGGSVRSPLSDLEQAGKNGIDAILATAGY